MTRRESTTKKKGKSKGKKCGCKSQVQTTRVSVGGGGVGVAPQVTTYAQFANPMPNISFPTYEVGQGFQPVKQEPVHAASEKQTRSERDDIHYGPFHGGGVLGGRFNNNSPSELPDAESYASTPSVKSEAMNDSTLSVIDRLYMESDYSKPRSEQGDLVRDSDIMSIREIPRAPPRYGGSISSGGMSVKSEGMRSVKSERSMKSEGKRSVKSEGMRSIKSERSNDIGKEIWEMVKLLPRIPDSGQSVTNIHHKPTVRVKGRTPKRDPQRLRNFRISSMDKKYGGYIDEVLRGNRDKGVLAQRLRYAQESAMLAKKSPYEASSEFSQIMPGLSGLPSIIV